MKESQFTDQTEDFVGHGDAKTTIKKRPQTCQVRRRKAAKEDAEVIA